MLRRVPYWLRTASGALAGVNLRQQAMGQNVVLPVQLVQ
jgi:hypothetical protein